MDWGFLSNNRVVAINAVLFDGVGKNSLNRVATVLSGNFVDNLSNFLVSALVANDAFCSFKSVVSSENNISFSSFNFGISYNDCSSGVRSIAINVSSTDNLGNITFLELG